MRMCGGVMGKPASERKRKTTRGMEWGWISKTEHSLAVDGHEEELAPGRQTTCPAPCSRACRTELSGTGQGSCLVIPWGSEKGILTQ